MKRWHKLSPVFSNHITLENIDTQHGIIKNVVLVQSGVNKYGDIIDQKFLEQLVSQADAQTAGVKSRFGHPNMCDTTLGSFIGRYKNHRIGTTTRTDNGVAQEVPAAIADLHLDTVAKETPKGNLYDYVLQMAQKNPDMFGNSIVFAPDKSEMVMEKNSVTGKDEPVPHIRMKTYVASDLVDSPAATGNLFNEHTDFAAVVTDFLDEHPEVYEIIAADEDVLSTFLKKYSANKFQSIPMKNEKSKSLVQKGKEWLAKILGFEMIQIETTDGKTINVNCANGTEPAQGDPVTDEAGAPVANATINAKDGKTITTDADGKITEVKPAPDSGNAPPPADQTNQNETDPETVESLSQKNQDLAAQLKAAQDQNAALTAQLQESQEELTQLQAAFEKTNEQLEFIAQNQRSDKTLNDGRQNFRHEKHERTNKLSRDEKKEQIKAGLKAAAPAAPAANAAGGLGIGN